MDFKTATANGITTTLARVQSNLLTATGTVVGMVKIASTTGWVAGATVNLTSTGPSKSGLKLQAIYNTTDMLLFDPATGAAYDCTAYNVANAATISQPAQYIYYGVDAQGATIPYNATEMAAAGLLGGGGGGGGGGTSSTFGAAIPAAGTAAGFQDSLGNMAPANLDALGNLKIAGSFSVAGSSTPADGVANPTTASLSESFSMGYNGTTWDRLRSTTANGLAVDVTRVTGNVAVTGAFWQATQPVSGTVTAIGTLTPGTGFANPTTAIGTMNFLMGYNGASWDPVQCEGIAADGDNSPGTGLLGTEAYPMVYNGSTWDRLRGTAAGGMTVSGNRTSNSAVPGATNIGALAGIATAAAPTYTEGRLVALSTDLTGALRTSGSALNVGTVGSTAPTSASLSGGSVVAFATITGAVLAGWSAGQQRALQIDDRGRLVVGLYGSSNGGVILTPTIGQTMMGGGWALNGNNYGLRTTLYQTSQGIPASQYVTLADGENATYIAYATGLAPTAAGALFNLESSGGRNLFIDSIEVYIGSQTTAGTHLIEVRRTSAASSGGTTMTPGSVQVSPAFAFSGIARYSATGAGTVASTISVTPVPVPGNAGTSASNHVDIWPPVDSNSIPPIRVTAGTANGICIYDATGGAGASDFGVRIVFHVTDGAGY